jgi:hypothetical protein
MEFEKQKPSTDDFRTNWERIYQQQEQRKKPEANDAIEEKDCGLGEQRQL